MEERHGERSVEEWQGKRRTRSGLAAPGGKQQKGKGKQEGGLHAYKASVARLSMHEFLQGVGALV